METSIDQCPLCESKKQTYLYKDFEGSHYVGCDDCGLTFQNPRISTKYEENYWGGESIDPDGKSRVLVKERDVSIKNKYGLTVFKDTYPYFKTDYVSLKNLIKLYEKDKISPPFYGNLMVLYARKI